MPFNYIKQREEKKNSIPKILICIHLIRQLQQHYILFGYMHLASLRQLTTEEPNEFPECHSAFIFH
jgi:hypothetical protein